MPDGLSGEEQAIYFSKVRKFFESYACSRVMGRRKKSDMRCENCTYWTGGLRVWGYCTQHSKDTLNTDSCIMWMGSGWVIKKQSNNHLDTNVGNIEYISKQDAVNACQEGWNNSIQDCINNIKTLKPSDVVQVVRCRDCIYMGKPECLMAYDGKEWTDEDGFCHIGDRGEE